MTFKKLYFFCCVLMCQFICAQSDTIVSLDEVVVSDSQLRNFSGMQPVRHLNDSIIRKNRPSLTSLLQFNSTIYFKENGFGMVSSPSFRGTSAQQTAVVWNGINVNSQFNGQTEFNSITPAQYNSVSVKAGGGSVIYGSSAIGGSIHLNNELNFHNNFSNRLHLEYGSFNTLGVHYNLNASGDRWSIQAGFSNNSSDNDFEYPNSDRKNLNGAFDNITFNANGGYKINNSNYLKFYSQVYNGERHFAMLTPTDTKTKYRDFTARNLIEWVSVQNQFRSKLKLAHLTEEYQFFGNVANSSHVTSIAETVVVKYDALYKINTKITANALIDYSQTNGRGDDISGERRNITSGAFLMKHEITEKLRYEIGLRTEITNNYDSPFLFSAGASYKASDFYKVKINGSRNFRIPTFNDLYWTQGGNPNLKPETSYQAELGNEFTFSNVKLSVTGFAMRITDMIQWLPGTTTMWLPQNVTNVETYGAEILLNWKKEFGRHSFATDATYAYTISQNVETKRQLIYVPIHKATAALAYSYAQFSANYQLLFNGEVFTRGDNNPIYNLDAYSISNFSVDYTLSKLYCTVGIRILNVWDEEYQVVERRAYPGRNYNFYLIFNL